MPYCIVKGTALPGGTSVTWTKTRIVADLCGGDGWVIEGPVAEVWPWSGALPAGTVVQCSPGPFDPSTVVRAVRATDWASTVDAAGNVATTLLQLKSTVTTTAGDAVAVAVLGT